MERKGRAERRRRKAVHVLLRKAARLLALSPSDVLLLLEAWSRLALARLGVFNHSVFFVTAITDGGTDTGLDRIERLFLAAVRHQPGTVGCVPRARALRALLVRRGYPAVLRVGLRRDAKGLLEGHAWTEVRGNPVAEGPALLGFVVLESAG